jgi:hypothetical protein
MMIRETAQPPFISAPKANGVIDIGCLASAPRRSLVQLVSQGLACVHDITNLRAITTTPALYWEQINEC